MKSELKRKTVNGLFWSLIENIFGLGQQIFFGIILARLLAVEDYGLLAMVTFFILLGQVFVDSGLSHALIRKQTCDNTDYSTVFWTNIAIGCIFYIIIWFISPYIALYYKKPELISLTRIASISIIIASLSIIQQTIFTKEVNFKVLTAISAISTFISGVVSVLMAYKGYGVWSLVWGSIINQTVRSILFLQHNKWVPKILFSKSRFRELFSFGFNILIISIISNFFKSINNIILGKHYISSPEILGYYNQADRFSTIPSSIITALTTKVTYPIMASVQDDNIRLKNICRKFTKTLMYVSFIVMFGLVAVAWPLFAILFQSKWLPAVKLFQLLCITYSIFPILLINMNIMKVKGRSDLFLRTEIIKYSGFVPIVILGMVYGLQVLMIGLVIFYWLSIFVSAMYTKKLINYTILEQLQDFIPVFLICFLPTICALVIGHFIHFGNIVLILVQGFIYLVILIGLSILFKLPSFFEILDIFILKLRFFLNKKM